MCLIKSESFNNILENDSGSKVSACNVETWIRSLGWEDKETATHSSTLAWKIPWTEEPGTLQTMGSQRVGYN